MFSAVVSASNSEKCWKTMPMPSALACIGLVTTTGWSFQKIVPPSGCSDPNSIFTRVDLPRAVLAEQRVDFAGNDVQIDAVIGLERAERL